MLGLHAGVYREFGHAVCKLVVWNLRHVRARYCLTAVGDDAQLHGYGNGGVEMVARYHDGTYARFAAALYRLLDFGTDGVYHTHEAYIYEILLHVFRLVGYDPGVFGVCGGEHAQRPVRHALVVCERGGAQLVGHGHYPAAFQRVRAAGQHFVGRTLGITHVARGGAVDRRHHLAFAVEGHLAYPRRFRFHGGFIQSYGGSVIHERALRRLAYRSALGGTRVRTQREGAGEQLLVPDVVDDGHLVLRQRAGFVRADYLRAAQRFDGGLAAYDGVLFGHAHDAHGQRQRHDHRHAFGYGSNGEADRYYEAVEHRAGVKLASGDEADDEHDGAYTEYDIRKQFGQLAELTLKRRLLFLDVGEHAGDLAHFGIHAHGGHDAAAAAVDDGGTAVRHVAAVAERDSAL